MTSLQPDLFSDRTTVLLDQVGVDGTTVLCSVIAGLVKESRSSLCLVSYKETFPKFRLLLRKLGVLDLALLEAQGRVRFATRFDSARHHTDDRSMVVIHGGSFAELGDLMGALDCSQAIVHIHKDMDERVWRYAVRHSHLVLDLQPLASGFSQHIFGRLEVYPGGLCHPKPAMSRQCSNVKVTDGSVALVECLQ